MKLAQYNAHLISTVDTDGQMLQHQGISSHSAEYALMCFPVFKSQTVVTHLTLFNLSDRYMLCNVSSN